MGLNQILSAVNEMRQEADYDLIIFDENDKAELAIQYAEQFIAEVKSCLLKN